MGSIKLRLRELLIGGIAAVTSIAAFSSTVHASGSTTMYFQSVWPKVYGAQMIVQVRVNTNGDHVNTAEADFTYPTNMLQFVSIDSASSSAFTVNASATGGGGSVSIQRGSLASGGVTGDQKVANVTFNVIGTGTANLSFQNTSEVDDANTNTNDLMTMTDGSFIDSIVLVSGQVIQPGGELFTTNLWRFVMQTDGNLVVRDPQNHAVWSTHSASNANSRLVMQTDGNLVIRSAQNNVLWVTNTSGHNGSRLVMQTDGNLVIRTPANTPIWTRTQGRLY